MPADNIKRAIQRGTGEIEGVVFDEITYEGYGPGGVAVLVACLTDNRNRTVADVRSYFSKCGGNLGESGSVGWMFDSRGVVSVPADGTDEDTVTMAAIDAGAEDVRTEGESIDVITRPEDVQNVRQALADAGIAVTSAEVTMLPKNTITLQEKEASQVLRLVEMLEDHDDVQNVYANFDIPDDILEKLAS
jgi:YebC/PmpR family DNA-binding regulatory protein